MGGQAGDPVGEQLRRQDTLADDPAAADSFAELVISQIGARADQPVYRTSLKDIAA